MESAFLQEPEIYGSSQPVMQSYGGKSLPELWRLAYCYAGPEWANRVKQKDSEQAPRRVHEFGAR